MACPIPDPNRIQNLLADLVTLKSVTGSYGEDDILEFIEGYIKRRSKGGIELHRLAYEREIRPRAVPEEKWALAAIKRGRGKDGILLVGHIDTIDTSDYGFLEPVATQPKKLLSSLRSEMAGRRPVDLIDNRLPLSPLGAEHAEKDDHYWGRGSLDMKSGVAILVETLLAWEEEDPTLVLLLTPDEESDSAGIKHALPQLGLMMRRAKINLLGAVGADFYEPEPGSSPQARQVHTGFMGKVLVGVYYRAATGHVSDGGVASPSTLRLGARIVERLEGCEALREECQGEPLPPPTMLRATDLRERYDTRLPGEFWGYLHVPTCERRPHDVLALVRAEVQATVEEFNAETNAQTGLETPEVLFLDVPSLVEKPYNFVEGDDLREVCRQKFLASAIYQRVRPPWAIVALMPPLYPSYFWREEKFQAFSAALERGLAKAGRKNGVKWGRQPFYPNVHDLSLLVANRDAWLQFIPEQPLKITRPKGLGVSALPMVNIGPSGHGAHSAEERVLLSDALETVPTALSCFLEAVFGLDGGAPAKKPAAKKPAAQKAAAKKPPAKKAAKKAVKKAPAKKTAKKAAKKPKPKKPSK